MKKCLIAVILLAVMVAGSTVWACPPPSAPDYDGDEVGGGPPDDPGKAKDKDGEDVWGWGDKAGEGQGHDMEPPRDPATKPGKKKT